MPAVCVRSLLPDEKGEVGPRVHFCTFPAVKVEGLAQQLSCMGIRHITAIVTKTIKSCERANLHFVCLSFLQRATAEFRPISSSNESNLEPSKIGQR
jgi:hypothetical protein